MVKKLLQRALTFLFHPIVIRVVGLILLYVVLVVARALLGEHGTWLSDAVIWTVTILAAVVVALQLVFQRLYAKKRSISIEQKIREQSQSQLAATMPGQRGDIQELEKRFQEAMHSLKQSRLGGGALYALPWYVIIGPPGCGKTTLLTRSGLNFPSQMNEGRGVRGIGGTRNCDWWFTDSAILLDTAGRYTTESEDHEEWTAFLDMLRKARRECPLNGLMVAISIEDVIGGTPEQLERHAERIRARIDEVTERLGMVLPIYLMFTKCDLMEGFVEAFSSMNKEEREQVWGRTLTDADRQRRMHEVFAEGFDELVHRLRDRRLLMMAEDRPMAQQRKVFGFPLQFAVVRDRMIDFVRQVTQSNPYRESAELRGYYFTSGTQEGTAVDRVLSDMGGIFKVSEEQESFAPVDTKAYFIHDLITEVIVPDQDLARRSSDVVKRQRRLRLAGFIGSAAAALLLSVLLISGTVSEYGRIDRAWAAVTPVREALAEEIERSDDGEFDPSNPDEDDREHMDALRREFVAARQDHAEQFGLLGPSRQLVDGLWLVYRDALSDAYLEPIAGHIKGHLIAYRDRVEADPGAREQGDAAELSDLLFVYNTLTDPDTLMQPQRLQEKLEQYHLWTWNREQIMQPLGDRDRRDPQVRHKEAFIDWLIPWPIGGKDPLGGRFAPADPGFAQQFRVFIDSLTPGKDIVKGRLQSEDRLLYARRADIANALRDDARQLVLNEGGDPDKQARRIEEKLAELVGYCIEIRNERISRELAATSLGAGAEASVPTVLDRLDSGGAREEVERRFLGTAAALLDGTSHYQSALYGTIFEECFQAVTNAAVTIKQLRGGRSDWVVDLYKQNRVGELTGAVRDAKGAVLTALKPVASHSEVLGSAARNMFERMLDDMVTAVATEAERELANRWAESELSRTLREMRGGFPFNRQQDAPPVSTLKFKRTFRQGGLLDQELDLLEGLRDQLASAGRSVPFDLSTEMQSLRLSGKRIRELLLEGEAFKELRFSLPRFGPQGGVSTYVLQLDEDGDKSARNFSRDVEDQTFSWKIGTTGAELRIKRSTNSTNKNDIEKDVGDPQDAWSLYRVLFHPPGPEVVEGNRMAIRIPFQVRKDAGAEPEDKVLEFHIEPVGAPGENPFDPNLFDLPVVNRPLKVR